MNIWIEQLWNTFDLIGNWEIGNRAGPTIEYRVIQNVFLFSPRRTAYRGECRRRRRRSPRPRRTEALGGKPLSRRHLGRAVLSFEGSGRPRAEFRAAPCQSWLAATGQCGRLLVVSMKAATHRFLESATNPSVLAAISRQGSSTRSRRTHPRQIKMEVANPRALSPLDS